MNGGTNSEVCYSCRGVGTTCEECSEPRCEAATTCSTCGGSGRVPAGTSMRENDEEPPGTAEPIQLRVVRVDSVGDAWAPMFIIATDAVQTLAQMRRLYPNDTWAIQRRTITYGPWENDDQ